MKILHVVHGYYPESDGGIERYLRRLLPAQQQRGDDVTLLTGSLTPWEQCGLERVRDGSIDVVRLHRDDLFFDHHAKAWHPGAERLIADLLARLRPDVVHVHQWIRLTANLVEIAANRGCAAVVTLHDVYTSCPRAFRIDRDGRSCVRPLSVASCLWCVPRYGHEAESEVAEGIALFADHTKAELLRAQAVLVASEAVAELVAATTDVPRARIAHLSLPYAPRLPARCPPARGPSPSAPLRFSYFGALARHKGVSVLIAAFAHLCRERLPQPVELHLFGGDETPAFGAELRVQAQGLPITFHGAYTPQMLASAGLHVAAFPSLAFETFGLVLDEAFELGLPVLVSDIGALPVRAASAGVRVPPGDVAAWCTAMRDLVADPERISALAARIPPPPPSLDEHTQALAAVYEAARAAPPRATGQVDPLRRAAFLVRQRESALGCITPEGGPR